MFLIQSAVILQEPITDLTQFECDIVVGKAENYRER
jgi:hypothetical protein